MPFNIGDIVDTATGSRHSGRVRYLACGNATSAGGRTCDKKTCAHPVRDYVWILWPGTKNTASYHETELALVQAVQTRSAISNTESQSNKPILPDEKALIEERFDKIEKTEKSSEDGIDWNKYNGFDKRWVSKKDYPDKEQLPESAMTKEWWDAYTGMDRKHLIDKRTIR